MPAMDTVHEQRPAGPWWRAAIALAATTLAVWCAGAAAAADAPPRPAGVVEANPDAAPDAALDADRVRARLAALGPNETEARAAYEAAIAELERAATARALAERYLREAAEAPATLETIRGELEQPPAERKPEHPADATLATLEQLQATALAELTAARAALTEIEGEAARRQERRAQMPTLLAQARQRVDELLDAVASMGAVEADDDAGDARRTLLMAQRGAAEAELAALEAELTNEDARRDVLPARRDRAARRVGEAEAYSAAWQRVVSARRQSDAEVAALAAGRMRREAARQHAALRGYAEETERLAALRTERTGLPARITAASEQAAESTARLASLRSDFASVRRRIEASGLNRATGLLLRRQYDALPEQEPLRRRISRVERDLEEAEYALLERQDARAEAGNVDAAVRAIMLGVEPQAENRADLEAAARDLVVARRDLLSELVNDSTRYLEALYELDLVTRDLLEATAAYEAFIRERILWVRSIAGDRWPDPADFRAALRFLLGPDTWSAAWQQSVRHHTANPATAGLGAVAVIAAFVAASAAKRRLARIAELVSRSKTDAFSHTLVALALTVVAASAFPALLWYAGLLVKGDGEVPPGALAAASGLQVAAVIVLPIRLLSQLVRPRGLADAHFRWPAAALAVIRGHMRWFTPVAAGVVVVVVAMDDPGEEAYAASLGRVAFTVGMVAFTVLIARTLRPDGPVLAEFFRRNPTGWSRRLRFLWFPLAVTAPLGFATVSWLGYAYTATRLESRLEDTIALGIGLLVANGVLLRWLFIARRRVAIDEARRRREQALAEASQPEAGKPAQSSPPAIDEDKLDLPAISEQTRRLFSTAIAAVALLTLFAIWADVLPALRMLDRVEIYPKLRLLESFSSERLPILEHTTRPGHTAPATGGVNGSSAVGQAPTQAPPPGAGGEAPAAAPSLPGLPQVDTAAPADAAPPVAVTLADVGAALLVLIATSVAFRNLPALVEISLLQRLPLDAASRYAISTVLRYLIAIVGVAAAFGAVNVSWSRVQWLAAALTFGLAFGLQEIFANFVSGLIILAERPIRIGDTVTVGSVSGTVTRIRMRATTITDWERKELIIPNKTFITGEVINWTLSDSVLRLTVAVGLGYAADIRRAESLLLEIAAGHRDVLKDPKPYVVFTRFGDSTLDFELRVFIPHVDRLLTVRHDLHMRITEAFRVAGLEIAYPQREVHIRSVGELAGLTPPRGDRSDT